jgi:hypothetical protein
MHDVTTTTNLFVVYALVNFHLHDQKSSLELEHTHSRTAAQILQEVAQVAPQLASSTDYGKE